jgi:hypothetical protein
MQRVTNSFSALGLNLSNCYQRAPLVATRLHGSQNFIDM